MSRSLLNAVPELVQELFVHKRPVDAEDVVHGAIAGAIGGLVGTLAMATFQQLWMRGTAVVDHARHREPSDEDRNLMKNAGIGSGEFPQSEPRSHHQRISPSERLVATTYRTVGRRPAKRIEMKIGGSAVHFAFGATMGAIYGAAAELEPAVTIGQGTAFGTAVFIAADEVALPLTGLAQSPLRTPVRRHLYSLMCHFAYGAATEATRRLLRDA